jgi:hypothetical protein
MYSYPLPKRNPAEAYSGRIQKEASLEISGVFFLPLKKTFGVPSKI